MNEEDYKKGYEAGLKAGLEAAQKKASEPFSSPPWTVNTDESSDDTVIEFKPAKVPYYSGA